MIELRPIHSALLELGLEDWIPLPEALESMKFEGYIGDSYAIETISQALIELLHDDRIQVWRGPWHAQEPTLVSKQLAEALLLDHSKFSLASEANAMDRVYYVNVENFRA